MDPITTAIVAALATGVTTGVAKVGESVIPDAYNAIKKTIQNKFGTDNKLVKAVNELEAEPDFEANKTALAGRVAQFKADKDSDILQAAKVLLEAINNNPEVIFATGVNLESIKGASLKIDDIIATGTGVNVQQGEFSGDINISKVRAGQKSDPKA
ncbi:MAG: hypothetical protein GY928_40040 [Colwellia sp.]|nr:hypothetical protein [Colwellia sp.]